MVKKIGIELVTPLLLAARSMYWAGKRVTGIKVLPQDYEILADGQWYAVGRFATFDDPEAPDVREYFVFERFADAMKAQDVQWAEDDRLQLPRTMFTVCSSGVTEITITRNDPYEVVRFKGILLNLSVPYQINTEPGPVWNYLPFAGLFG